MTAEGVVRGGRSRNAASRNAASWKWWAKLRPNSGAYAWKPPVPRWNLPTDSFTVSNGRIHLQPGAQLWLTGKGICFENVKFTGIAVPVALSHGTSDVLVDANYCFRMD
jgi:hypothetical protein